MANWYVAKTDVNGNPSNNNNSGTENYPWLEIQHGVDQIAAGDTLYVSNGTYHEVVRVDKNGLRNPVGNSLTTTIKAKSGQTRVYVDGQASGVFSGLPQGSLSPLIGQSGMRVTYAHMVSLVGKYIVWDGIHITGSLGRGIAVHNYASQITVKNCKIYNNRSVNILIYETDNVTIDNVETYLAGVFLPSLNRYTPNWQNHPGCLTIYSSNTVNVKNCIVHTTWTEGIMADANVGGSTNITIEDNIVYDTMSPPIYIHRVTDVVCQRNFVYQSSTDKARTYPDGPMMAGIGAGITITSNEEGMANYSTDGVKVVSNIVANISAKGISARGKAAVATLKDVLIANNTIANCSVGLGEDVLNKKDLVFKNNIITACTTQISGVGNLDWSYGYNHWDTTPSTFSGTGDVVGANVKLVNATHSPAAGEGDPTRFGLDTGSTAAGAGVDLTTAYATTPAADTTDFWGASRSAWDIGAHEDSGVYAPNITVVPTPDPAEINVGDLVDFNSTVTGGTPAGSFSYAWEFPGSSTPTSTDADPQNITYGTVGVFTAKVTVTDDATGITDEVTETVTVRTRTTTVVAPVNVEQVIFNAGAASYTVSKAPSAIIFMYGGGVSDGTATNESKLGFGIHDVGNSQGYGMGVFADHGVGTSNTSVGIQDGPAIFMAGVGESTLFTGTVNSVTATTVSLSWSGTTSSEKIISWNFYGSGVTNILATSKYMGASNSTNTITGDYTHVFMPAVLRPVDSIFGNIDCSMGVGIRDGGQMCMAYGQSDGKATTETFGKLWTDMIAGYARTSGASLGITSFTSSGVTFVPKGRDILTGVPMLLMKITGADTYLAVEDTPITAASTNYTDAGFDATVMMALLSNLTAIDTQDTGSATFGVLAVDSANVDRTIIMSSKDAIGTTVEKSYTDNDYAMLDEDGAMSSEGPATIIANGFNLTPTTADSTARKMITFLVEETATSAGGPDADFTWTSGDLVYTDTIQFTDLSDDDTVNFITGWDWDWGDGTAHGTTQNPTHQYAAADTYEVILEVTDDNSDTDTETKSVTVGVPDIALSFTVSPTRGATPLTVTLDASASTAGGDELLDEDVTAWTIYYYTGGFHAVIVEALGHVVDVVLNDIAIWSVACKITQASTGVVTWLEKFDVIEVTYDIISNFANQYNRAISITGPWTADFTATINAANLEAIYYDWDFGDGQGVVGYDKEDVSNIYAAHDGTRNYLTFNGTTTLINCGSDVALDDLHDDAFTVEAWVRATVADDRIVVCTGLTAVKWQLALSESDGLYGYIRCATTNTLSKSGLSEFDADGLWHHIAMTWDDSSYNYPRLWIDGTESTYDTTQNRSGAIVTDASENLYIGARGDGHAPWMGDIGWVRISDSVLYTTAFSPPSRMSPPATETTTVEQWNLNDNSGSTAAAEEDSPTNDGTITDGIWSDVGQQYYLTLNGTTSLIDCGSDAALDDLHDDAFTIEAWVKATTASGVVACTGVTTAKWQLALSATEGLSGLIKCVTTNALSKSGTSEFDADGLWHHIAMTWDDSSYNYPRLWIDGTESTYDSSQNRSGAIVTDASENLYIGARGDGALPWDGDMAWVRVSDSVLYTATFNPPSRHGPPKIDDNTVEQWSLNDGSGSTAVAKVDSSTNDGTITGGTWAAFTENYVFDVTLEATLPGGDTDSPDDTITKYGYVTIAPTSVPPLNVAELTAIAAEVGKHIGCLSDATWVVDGTYGNVYTATVSRKWASGYTYTVKEDAQDLSSQASIAACQSVAGSYYVSYSDPNLVVSVHTTSTDDPGTNGSVYSLRFT